jgi:hypothetical protein
MGQLAVAIDCALDKLGSLKEKWTDTEGWLPSETDAKSKKSLILFRNVTVLCYELCSEPHCSTFTEAYTEPQGQRHTPITFDLTVGLKWPQSGPG